MSKERLANLTEVKIYVDGPKNLWQWFAVRKVIAEASRKRNFLSQKVVVRKKNLGLARSIADGVTDTIRESKRVIVLEDDTVPLKGFLDYMSQALRNYEKNKKVFQVSGFRPPVKRPEKKISFSRLTTSWGWGTWARAWRHFKMDVIISEKLKKSKRIFDYDNKYPFYRLLQDAATKHSQSWGIRWYLACFQANGWTCYPPVSYIKNIGFDGSGEHTQFSISSQKGKPVPVHELKWPNKIYQPKNLKNDFNEYLRKIN